MPPEKRPFSSLETDIWDTQKSIIRKLYLEEKKTLKQVKEIMELHHGFPSFPLSTYGAKLRDQLNLPKKLKKNDWPVVYRHYQQREAEGKQTHMYLNDALIPWDKAWKEMRRNRVPFESGGTITTPLPRGVMLKTPPPPSPPSIRDSSSPLALMSPRIQGLHNVPINSYEPVELVQEPQQSFSLTIPFTDPSGNISSQSADFYRQLSVICLENTPWLALRRTLLRISAPTLAATPYPQFLDHDVEQTMNHSPAPPIPTSNEPSTQIDSLHTLAKVLYLISNALFSSFLYSPEDLAELFNLLCTHMPQRLALDLLDSNLPSAQAAREGITRLISSSNREDFISFMKLGLSRPAWILSYGHVYLSVAVSKRCIDIVRNLLQLGIRADEPIPEWTSEIESKIRPAIFEAVACRDVECLKLLVDNCDINSTVSTILFDNFSSSSLVLFCMANSCGCFSSIPDELEFDETSLAILLEHGADVDLPCPRSMYLERSTQLREGMSLLEHCYYCDKRMYSRLVLFSSRPAQGLYRDQTCIAAATGVSALSEYLNSRPGVDATFLKNVLTELFFVSASRFDSAVVLPLLEFGVTTNTFAPDECFTTLLCRIVRKARISSPNEIDVLIMQILLRNGALLVSRVLAYAVEDEGTRTLELMLTLGADFHHEGTRALYIAARRNNFVAVSWLLNKGVDINGEIKRSRYRATITCTSIIVAALIGDRDVEALNSAGLPNSISYDMTKYLMRHGAKLWAGSPNSDPYTALRLILEDSEPNSQMLDIVSFILSHGKLLKDLPSMGFHLLESSLRTRGEWSVFEFLWEHGAPVYPGATLARLITVQAPRRLILKAMESGADINAYTLRVLTMYDAIQAASLRWDRSLVSALLERGVDINSPALGSLGKTALQNACCIAPDSEFGRREQVAFVQFLLCKNADVNAPSTPRGYTALQYAVEGGNLELLPLLLSHGAQVNEPDHYHTRCVLDMAAEEGRLDTVHFLLTAGALSYCYGQSGYEGAIQLAEKEEFFTVANSLRSYVRNNERLFREHPDLAAAHSAAMAQRSWTDEDFEIEWSYGSDVDS